MITAGGSEVRKAPYDRKSARYKRVLPASPVPSPEPHSARAHARPLAPAPTTATSKIAPPDGIITGQIFKKRGMSTSTS